LSDVIVETHLGGGWKDVWQHQVRWARTIRVSKFWGYLGLPVTFATFWALVTLNWPLLLLRMAMALIAGRKHDLRLFYLVPLRDLFGVAVWVFGLFGNSVVWRNRKLALDSEGRIL
jgi:ceramide glucosyltransferase